MEYTKSEIREAKKRIKHELKIIEDRLPDIDKSWLPYTLILSASEALKFILDPLKTHIIDNDDYPFAVWINNEITPIWSKYWNIAKDDVSLQRTPAYEIQDIIEDLRDWIGEYEAEHLQQPNTPTNSPSAKDDGNSYITNDKILNALPDLYDCLIKNGVISELLIDKQDFGNAISSGSIPTLKKDVSYWVRKITHFKGFVYCIKPCFSKDWYITICKSAGLPEINMARYNTNLTADLERDLIKILKQKGIG